MYPGSRYRGMSRLKTPYGFSPAQISFTAGLWVDPSDIGTLTQDSAGTTPVTTAGNPVGRATDKSGRGNNLLQGTAGSRPLYQDSGSIKRVVLDGTDDSLATAAFAAGTLTNNMDCFLAIKRVGAGSIVAFANGPGSPGSLFGVCQSGSGVRPDASVGTPTYFVNGVAVTATRDALNTAMTVGSWHVLEVRNLDLSLWTNLAHGAYTGFILNGENAGFIICPAQSAANRDSLRRWLGAKVGRSL